MKNSRSINVSHETLRKESTMYRRDRQGMSMQELQAERHRLAKIANQRLLSLEKADRDYWAYDRAVLYTQRTRNRNRFSEAKNWKGTIQGLKYEVQRLSDFLDAKTSTVSGSRAVEKNIKNTLRLEHGWQSVDNKSFYNLLQTQQYKQAANKYLSSEILIDYIDRRVERGDTEEDIKKAIEAYNREEIHNVDELFKNAGMSVFRDE